MAFWWVHFQTADFAVSELVLVGPVSVHYSWVRLCL